MILFTFVIKWLKEEFALIVILEGLDNCGKNTMAKMLVRKYKNLTQIDFPDYTTAFGQFIRKQIESRTLPALSLQLLFSSERLSKVPVIQSLSQNGIVITTRYTYSAITYGTARGIDKSLLYLLEKSMPVPDKKIYLRISASDSIKRSSNPDLFEENFELLNNVEMAYNSIIQEENNWLIVDATQEIDDVFRDIEKIIF
jgi:dTMP kinase